VLEGEPDDSAARPTVKIRTPSAMRESGDRFDLVVNIDSMTELGDELASEYADRILDVAPLLLSINHELNSVRVHDLFTARGASIERHPNWLRIGYAEEIVRPHD